MRQLKRHSEMLKWQGCVTHKIYMRKHFIIKIVCIHDTDTLEEPDKSNNFRR